MSMGAYERLIQGAGNNEGHYYIPCNENEKDRLMRFFGWGGVLFLIS
jgi:hypothetical protein